MNVTNKIIKIKESLNNYWQNMAKGPVYSFIVQDKFASNFKNSMLIKSAQNLYKKKSLNINF